MNTMSEKREAYEERTGKRVRVFRAFPLIGRGSPLHDLISHEEVERRFKKAFSVSPFIRLSWLLGGRIWWR